MDPTTEMKAADTPPLRLSRLLHARRETVFKAWSTAEHIKQWFSPETCTVPHAKVEMRVGGPFDYDMVLPWGEEHRIRGVFVEVAPFTRLVIDMQVFDGKDAPLFRARTEVDLSDILGGTKMEVTQTYAFIDPAIAGPMVAGAQEGWRTTLDKLEALVVRMQGGGETHGRSVVHATFDLKRTYDAPVERVWKALTDEGAKQKWFGGSPGQWELLERQMDVRARRTRARSKADGKAAWFRHSTPPITTSFENERLVYTYELHLNDKKISVSLATMQLKAEGAKTTLSVTEQGAFLDGYDDAGSREHGTGILLDTLGASLKD